MKYCNRCLYPENHPYGIIFDDQGVCSGCRVHEEKDELNWNSRFKKLREILESNKKQMAGRGFDCIIPVTGGGDSYFIVHTVKNVLGMNPLLVNYNHQFNTKVGIRNLANLSTVFDCDIVTSTLSPALLKKITRSTIKKFGSIYWQVLAGYYTYPVQIATKFRIPLIIWGVQPWSEQTGMYSHIDESEMTERCRREHGLMGLSAEDIIDENDGITRREIQEFIYPYDNEIERIGVRGVYLSNYIRWDSKTQHEKMIDLYGYESAIQQRTFNTYEDVHCHHSAGLHDYIKFLKLGYSKVTDHASREIRLKRMTRSQGIQMVKRYSHIEPEDKQLFLDWVEMDEKVFDRYIYERRDPKIWRKSSEGTWELKDSVINYEENNDINSVSLEVEQDCHFKVTPKGENGEDNEYLLMGRCYLDKYNYGAIQDQPQGGLTPRAWKKKEI
tara:strand:- start:346 stop:1671 length:1326 start_codon:yes stop_codon:yes gene_type:complete